MTFKYEILKERNNELANNLKNVTSHFTLINAVYIMSIRNFHKFIKPAKRSTKIGIYVSFKDIRDVNIKMGYHASYVVMSNKPNCTIYIHNDPEGLVFSKRESYIHRIYHR